MSTDLAIRLTHVTKRYPRYAHPSLRLKAMLLRQGSAGSNPFTALQNISLEVPRGHTVGIVGRNGSGKSTLLQIVAGTLTPTEGSVEVHGRVSALLELGSGFSPDFTGRENVFFQGRILGCSHDFLSARFDAIAAFADIGDFLDQPIKTYSSGMMLRLAFAVAISVDPDILIVDEALAVGDEAFQRKCFARIRSIQDNGGTILFVSHSGSSIIELCDQAILIDAGEMLLTGEPKPVITHYHRLLFARDGHYQSVRQEIRAANTPAITPILNGHTAESPVGAAPAEAPAADDFFDPNLLPQSTINYHSAGATIQNPRICRTDGTPANVLIRGRDYLYRYDVLFTHPAAGVRFGMLIKTLTGLELGGATSHTPHDSIPHVDAGTTFHVEFRFRCSLTTGVYFTNAGVLSGTPLGEQYLHRIMDAVMFRVQPESQTLATLTVDFNIAPRITTATLPVLTGGPTP